MPLGECLSSESGRRHLTEKRLCELCYSVSNAMETIVKFIFKFILFGALMSFAIFIVLYLFVGVIIIQVYLSMS